MQRRSQDTVTPEETLETSFQRLRATLAQELLEQVLDSPPSLFEKLVVELLLKMGYGGTLKDAGQAIGRSGDEGIDGIIKEDHLGLDTIYVQAKRWQNTVSRPEIQKFAGALQGQRAKKGVFITTSDFSREAREYADRIDTKIVLIDGETLTDLMIPTTSAWPRSRRSNSSASTRTTSPRNSRSRKWRRHTRTPADRPPYNHGKPYNLLPFLIRPT